MPELQTISAQIDTMDEVIRDLKEIRSTLQGMDRSLTDRQSKGELPKVTKTALGLQYTQLETQADNVKTILDSITWLWAVEIYIGQGAVGLRLLSHFIIDTSARTIQAFDSDGAAFVAVMDDLFELNDFVEIVGAEDPDLHGIFAVASATTSILTVLSPSPPGADNLKDTSLLIRLTMDNNTGTP